MKQRIPILVAALLLAATASHALENQSYRLAAILSGGFQGSTPGNELVLSSQPFTADPGHPYDLFLSIRGKYQEESVALQGILRFDLEGAAVIVTYVPHFDPTITALSPQVDSFTDREATAACGMNFKQRGDGFTSETLGSSCALAVRGATSKWTIEVEPGTIRLRDAKTGETLRFKKTTKS